MTSEEIDRLAASVVADALTALTNQGLDLERVSNESRVTLTSYVRGGIYQGVSQTYARAMEAATTAVGNLRDAVTE